MRNQQRGFTLIELVVVIVLLGILAVTAAPKFLDLSSDAYVANLQAVQGSLKSANTLVHSKAIIHQKENGEQTVTIDSNGTEITTINGYIKPTAEDLGKALDIDFTTLINPSDPFTTDYGVHQSGSLVYILPKQDTNSSFTCHLRYNMDSSSVPVYALQSDC